VRIAWSLPVITPATRPACYMSIRRPCGHWQVNMYLKCVLARRTAGRRRGAAVENEPGMGQIDDEQSRRHPQAPLAPHGPSRAPPCRPTPSLHLTLARALTAQLTAVRLVPQVRSEAQGDPPSSSRAAPGGQRGQLPRPGPSPAASLAAGAGSPAAALCACAPVPVVLCSHACFSRSTTWGTCVRPCPACSAPSVGHMHRERTIRTVGLRVGSSVRSAP